MLLQLVFVNVLILFAYGAPVINDEVSSEVNTPDESKIEDQIGSESNLSSFQVAPKVETATYKLEQESIPSKIYSAYDNSQSKVNDFLNPKPLVDTIQEHEKYGNSGDRFYPVGRAIVNGYEGISNVLNKLIDAPVEVAKTLSRGLTNTLNSVGGRLVGL